MSWIQKLYKTYECCFNNKTIPDSNELCPVGYSVQNAHINVVLNINGNFRRASIIPKEEAKTLIPVTEKSLTGRTSGIAPHALCDSIQYCAGDYKAFGGKKESYFDRCDFVEKDFTDENKEWIFDPQTLSEKIAIDMNMNIPRKMNRKESIDFLNTVLINLNNEEIDDVQNRVHANRKMIDERYKHLCCMNTESYLLQLERWAESKYTHPKVKAIYGYVLKKQLIADLAKDGLVAVSDNALVVREKGIDEEKETHPLLKLLAFDDKGVKDQAKAFIIWTVEGDGNVNSNTWEDPTLFDSWRKYTDSLDSKVGFCYVAGKETVVAQKHPSRLRNGKDGAKLISSNDTSGYTFLGRFLSADQAAEVSSEITQKAHSALRWLIGRKQAFRNDTQTFVSWAVKGKKIPELCANSLEFLGDQEESDLEKSLAVGDVGQAFAQRLNKKIAGYRANIDDSEDIVVMGLDSATPGRMAITYYRELTGIDFLDRIEQWHSDFAWYQFFGKEYQFFGAPAPKDIAWAAFGKKIEGKNGAKLLNATVERILPCIVDGSLFPNDLVISSVRRASNRIGFKKERLGKKEYETEWEKCLGIACALFKGIHGKRRYEMALEVERKTRDYLYGRLLAVADRIETTALAYAKENRDTTASRLMQRFSDRPFSTWKTIHDALVPYETRIRSRAPGLLLGYNELLDEIHCSFSGDDFRDDNPLNGEHLLGFHCQRKWLRDRQRKAGQWVLKGKDEPDIQASDIEEEK